MSQNADEPKNKRAAPLVEESICARSAAVKLSG
jgi:hypothetical protein